MAGDVLGSLLSLDGKTHTVVGVLPPGFEGHALNQGADGTWRLLMFSRSLPVLQIATWARC